MRGLTDASLNSIVLGWMESLGPTTAASLAACLGLPARPHRGRADPQRSRRSPAARPVHSRHHGARSSASAASSPASTASPSAACAARSSRSPPPSSSASCSAGSASSPARSSTAPRACSRSSASCKASPSPPAPGSATCCPRASPSTTPPGSTSSACHGEVAWGRLDAPRCRHRRCPHPPARSPTRAAPVALVLRRDLPWLLEAARAERHPIALGSAAAALKDLLAARGASFLSELVAVTGRMEAELTQGLWELVAAGQVTCDGFAGLRTLMTPVRKHEGRFGRRRPQGAGGRWSLFGSRSSLRPQRPGFRQLIPSPISSPSPPNTFAATASSSAISSSASPPRRPGASSSPSSAASKRAASCAAAASSPATSASSSRSPPPSICSARSAARTAPASWSSSAPPIR